MCCGFRPRRPDIEKEAVFAVRSGIAAIFFRYAYRLQASFAEGIRPAYPSPRGHRLGLAPAELADRRSRVGNSLEDEDAALGCALKITRRGSNDKRAAAGSLPGSGRRLACDGPEPGHDEHAEDDAEDNDAFHR